MEDDMKFPIPFGGCQNVVTFTKRIDLQMATSILLSCIVRKRHAHNFAVDSDRLQIYVSTLGLNCLLGRQYLFSKPIHE